MQRVNTSLALPPTLSWATRLFSLRWDGCMSESLKRNWFAFRLERPELLPGHSFQTCNTMPLIHPIQLLHFSHSFKSGGVSSAWKYSLQSPELRTHLQPHLVAQSLGSLCKHEAAQALWRIIDCKLQIVCGIKALRISDLKLHRLSAVHSSGFKIWDVATMWRSASLTTASTLSTLPNKDETKSQRELMSCSCKEWLGASSKASSTYAHVDADECLAMNWIDGNGIPFLASLFAPDLRKECPEMWSTQIPRASSTWSWQAQHAYAPHVQTRLYPQTCQDHRVAQTTGNFSAPRHRQTPSMNFVEILPA